MISGLEEKNMITGSDVMLLDGDEGTGISADERFMDMLDKDPTPTYLKSTPDMKTLKLY